MPEARVGWQPSRFLADRGEAERAFALGAPVVALAGSVALCQPAAC
jgi:hypothetical protein